MSALTTWLHERLFDVMSKARPSPSKNHELTDASPASEASVSDTKDSVNLRIDARARQLIDEAATVLGKTRTEFMIESARREAIDVVLDQRVFLLDAARYDAFVQGLDNPPPPGPKLRSLLRRVPAWQK
jgi:uncharacterized protein (DUF1778 family)